MNVNIWFKSQSKQVNQIRNRVFSFDVHSIFSWTFLSIFFPLSSLFSDESSVTYFWFCLWATVWPYVLVLNIQLYFCVPDNPLLLHFLYSGSFFMGEHTLILLKQQYKIGCSVIAVTDRLLSLLLFLCLSNLCNTVKNVADMYNLQFFIIFIKQPFISDGGRQKLLLICSRWLLICKLKWQLYLADFHHLLTKAAN